MFTLLALALLNIMGTPSPAQGQSDPLPPEVIGATPENYEEIDPAKVIELTFDQPMDQGSLSPALTLKREVIPANAPQGQPVQVTYNDVRFVVAWKDPRTLTLTPEKIERGARYLLRISTEAKSSAGVKFTTPYTLTFDGAGALTVQQTIPAANIQVEAANAITVVFNRPVVPLVDSESQAGLPQPLKLSPEVKGKGEWVNTSVYVFKPDVALIGGTEFTATVDGVKDINGTALERPFTWKFKTAPPRVLSVSPQLNQSMIPVDTSIIVTFNQPMKRASVEENFRLMRIPGTTATPGKFTWDSNDSRVAFRPAQRLAFEAVYQIEVKGGESAGSTTKLEGAISQQFSTVPLPKLVLTRPTNGDSNVPVNSQVNFQFNTNMSQESFIGKVKVTPLGQGITPNINVYGQGAYIYFPQDPLTEYTVTLEAGIKDTYGNSIDQPITIKFRTGKIELAASLQIPQVSTVNLTNAYLPETGIYVQTVNVKTLNVTVVPLTLADMVVQRQNYTGAGLENLPGARNFTVNTEFVENKTLLTRIKLAANGGVLPPGLYGVRVNSPDLRRSDGYQPQYPAMYLAVGTANLTMKTSEKEVLVWATDLKTGLPIPNADIQVSENISRLIGTQKTDQNGLARFELLNANDRQEITAQWKADSNYALAGLSYGMLDVYTFGANQTNNNPHLVSYFYTDQPIYRPMRPVYFRAILRDQNDVIYNLPKGKTAQIVINNADGVEVSRQTLPISDFGTFAGQYDLKATDRLGPYSVNMMYEGNSYALGNFQVAEYRVPEFQVEVKTDKAEHVRGKPVKVTVNSKYFFGGAVNNARVSWTVNAIPTFFNYKGEGNYEFGVNPPYYFYYADFAGGYRGANSRNIANGQGQTDSDGNLTFEFTPQTSATQPETLSIEATVADITNQSVSGRTSITVHPAELYIGLKSASPIAEEKRPITIDLIAVDWESKPIPQTPIKVRVVRNGYTQNVKTLQYEATQTEVFTETVTTDAKGVTKTTFTPDKAGQYQVFASALDKGERKAESAMYLWVSGQSAFEVDRSDRNLRMISARTSYKPGQTADILIPSPYTIPVKALVTVERAGIMKQEVITVQGGTRYSLPITELHAPDVYLSVTLIKPMGTGNDLNPDYRFGVLKLNVEVRQQLTVKLTPNVQQAAPGEKVRFTVLTTDRDGKPIPAAVGLKLTDLANLSLSEDGLTVSAAFNTFWGDRGLSVFTEISLKDLLDGTVRPASPAVAQLAGVAGGGAGGAAFDSAQAEGLPAPSAAPPQARKVGQENSQGSPQVRTNFVDTPLWQPDVITDANGQATVEVTLPDNLTTWRLDGRGFSKETYIGQSTTDLISTKPLLVRPATPRFFVVGDEAELAVVVNNNTLTDQVTEVTITAEGVTLTGNPTTSVTIPKNGRARVAWRVKVNDVPNVKVIFAARAGNFSDAAAPDVGIGDNRLLPVYKYLTRDSVSTAGVLTAAGSKTEGIRLPKGAAAAQSGTLTVQVDSSLAEVAIDGLTYLKNYEYQCTEQTVSRFLPNAVTLRALRRLGVNRPDLSKNLGEALNFAMTRLRSTQHSDGGWGWYSADRSNPMVTAYAAYALQEVEALDTGILTSADRGMLDRAYRFLVTTRTVVTKDTPFYELNQTVFVEYVLSRSANRQYVNPNALETLYAQSPRMSLFAQAWLAQSYLSANTGRDRVNSLIANLNTAAIQSATGTHWEESQRDWWSWSSDTRTTAIILSTLVRAEPTSPLIPNVVRWLMVARKGDAWETTQETAWAVIGLADFMVATGELEGNYEATVAFNGSSLFTGNGKIDKQVTQSFDTATLKKLSEDVGRLVFRRGEGKGSLYYTANLQITQPVEAVKPLNRGFSLNRKYLVNGKAVNEAKVGDLITVSLEITVNRGVYYVVIDDPIPAGTEMVDSSLRTTPQNVGTTPAIERIDYKYGWGWWWFSDTQLKTEKAVLNARYLPAGTYQYTYTIKATTPGVYRVIPPNGNEFYFPEVFGRGAGSLFTVKGE
jgi:hypothetical protein